MKPQKIRACSILTAFLAVLSPQSIRAAGDLLSNPEFVANNTTDRATLQSLADQGYADAQYRLAEMYDADDSSRANVSQALYWYKKAGSQNHPWAADELGDHFANGVGVPRSRTRAVFWYRIAASHDDPGEQLKLGKYLMRDGRCSVSECGEAVKWLTKADAGGEIYASRILGDAYHNRLGVARNDEKAVEYYSKIAPFNYRVAFMIGQIYSRGLPGSRYYPSALFWFDIAASPAMFGSGPVVAEAERDRERISASMTPDQVANASGLAAAWIAKHTIQPPPLVMPLPEGQRRGVRAPG